ncbi:MAG: glycosyltransferase family 4 protein [Candidatus Bathyarchaeia archaeon]
MKLGGAGRKMGYGCYVSTAGRDKSIRGEKISQALGLDHIACASKPLRYTLYPLEVFMKLLQGGYEFVIVNNVPAHIVLACWLASKLRRFLLFVDFVNLWQFAVRSKYPALAHLTKLFEDWVYRKVKSGISINNLLSSLVMKRWGITTLVVYDAAEDRFTPAYRIGNSIIAVANLRRDEGVDILIEALSLLKKRQVSFHCTIIGAGDEMENLKNLSRSLSIEKQVEFLGWIPHHGLPAYYRRSSIGVIPIRATSPVALPLKLFEMLSSGLAVVASDTPAIRTILTPGEGGLLFTPGEVADLAQQLELVLSNHSLQGRLQKNARLVVEKGLNWSRQVARLQDFINNTLTKGAITQMGVS